MTPFAIAGVQMHVGALHSNVEAMRQRIEILMARFPRTQMVLFSELAPYGPLDRFAQPFPNDAITQFQEDAKRYGIWLIPGSMFEKMPDGRIFNTSVVINPQGEIVRKYSKMFPFRPYEQGISAGTDFCVFDVPDVGRFGLSICYDIWFPETTRHLTSQGVEVLLHLRGGETGQPGHDGVQLLAGPSLPLDLRDVVREDRGDAGGEDPVHGPSLGEIDATDVAAARQNPPR